MRARYVLPLVAFLALAVLLATGLTRDPRQLPSALINQAAPAFELANVVSGLDSTVKQTVSRDGISQSTFSSSAMLGKKWVLNVWASWCVSCRVEHPLFNQLAGLELAPIVGLNYKDKPELARQWLAERGNPYSATPADITGRVGINWGVVAVPETFIIDEQGQIIYKHTGPIDQRSLDTSIIPLLKE